MTATKRSAPKRQPKLTGYTTVSATELLRMPAGAEYVVEWNDGDRQRYRVEEIRGGYIVRKRWIEHLGKWSEWDGVQKASEVARHTVELK